jgi:trans-aconitate 2-methyltransferase
LITSRRREAVWDPGQYHKFGDYRLRPALELFERAMLALGDRIPSEIYDLGCGGGEIARIMAARWPAAHVVGLDSSDEMLAKAAAGGDGNSVDWVAADVRTWTAEPKADLLYSNAMFQWVDGHAEVFPHLVRQLAPGGVLAVQMPLSFGQRSHALLRDVLENYGTRELRRAVGRKWVEDAEWYYDLLKPITSFIDIWEVSYQQVLQGDDPVLEWVKGSALRPVLTALPPGESERLLSDYGAALREAYPKRAAGETLFPFQRLFIVAGSKV